LSRQADIAGKNCRKIGTDARYMEIAIGELLAKEGVELAQCI
jgi:hypothetical protein